MKFETRSGVNRSLFLSVTKKNITLRLFLHDKIFGAVTRIRLNAMSGLIRKLIAPAKTQLQRYVEEVSSLLLSTVEEKTVMEDEL